MQENKSAAANASPASNVEFSQIAPDVTAEDFLSGRTGIVLGFPGTNQTLVDLWGEGFRLTGPLDAPNELGRYCQARDQLAQHMWKALITEYVRFGAAPAVCAWYDETVNSRREALIDLAAKAVALRQGKLADPATGFVPLDRFLKDPSRAVVVESNEAHGKAAATAPATFGSLHVLPATSDFVCAVTGEASTVVVKFVLNDWQDMELLLGVELPKVLQGWERYRAPLKHRRHARYDAAGMVGSPIEHGVYSSFNKHKDICDAAGLNLVQEEQYLSAFNPNIYIGFCEKGIQKIWKKLGL